MSIMRCRCTPWAACVALGMLVLGCTGKDSDKEQTSAEESLKDLDCTNEEGRPEDLLPAQDRDVYHPDVMAMYLEKFDFLRKELGTTSVTTCEQAWKFAQLYEEHREEIVDAMAAEDLPEMDVPEMDDSGDVAGGEDDAVPEPEGLEDQTEAPPIEEGDTAAEASVTQSAPAEIEKITNGIDSNYGFDISLVVGGAACSATVIGARAILTAAHCVPATGWYQIDLRYQFTPGAATTSIFAGARWIYLYRHPYYFGEGNNDWDVGVGVMWENYASYLPSWMWTKLYAGDISTGGLQYHVGYGLTGPGTSYGHQHYGYGKISYVGARSYGMEPWDPSYPRAICQGDSGGSTGMWLDGAFVLYGINSAAWCGAVNNSTSYAAIVTRVRYNMDFVEPALANSNIFCQHGTAGGAAIRYCW